MNLPQSLIVAADLPPHAEWAERRGAPGDEALHAAVFPFEGKMGLAGETAGEVRRHRESTLARVRSRLDGLLAAIPGAVAQCVSHVSGGDPAPLVCGQAAALVADLVAMFKRGRSFLEDWIPGGVTRHTLFHANSNVPVVPAGATHAAPTGNSRP